MDPNDPMPGIFVCSGNDDSQPCQDCGIGKPHLFDASVCLIPRLCGRTHRRVVCVPVVVTAKRRSVFLCD